MLTVALCLTVAAISVSIGALGDPRAKLDCALNEAATFLHSNLPRYEAKNHLITLPLRSIHITYI